MSLLSPSCLSPVMRYFLYPHIMPKTSDLVTYFSLSYDWNLAFHTTKNLWLLCLPSHSVWFGRHCAFFYHLYLSEATVKMSLSSWYAGLNLLLLYYWPVGIWFTNYFITTVKFLCWFTNFLFTSSVGVGSIHVLSKCLLLFLGWAWGLLVA